MTTFSENLKALRIKHGLTQKELADILNVSQNAIHNWEHGKREPNREMIDKIAATFNVSPIALSWGSEFEESWNNLINKKEKIKNSSTEILNQLLSEIRNIIFENNNADIFTEIPEEDLLYYFWSLNDEGQQKVIKYAEDIMENQRYRKDEENFI